MVSFVIHVALSGGFSVTFYLSATKHYGTSDYQLPVRIDCTARKQFSGVAKASQYRCYLNFYIPVVGDDDSGTAEYACQFDLGNTGGQLSLGEVEFNTSKDCSDLTSFEILGYNLTLSSAEDINIVHIIISGGGHVTRKTGVPPANYENNTNYNKY